MSTMIQSFSENEYLIIFIAFIYGHTTTVFFSGWSNWIQNRKSIIFSIDHLLFSVLILLLIIDIWWVSYFRVNFITHGLLYFFLSLITPVNMYILATIVFPRTADLENSDLAQYFKSKERILYTLLAFNFLFNVVEVPFLETGMDSTQENYFRLCAFVICLFGIIIEKRWFRRALMISGLCVLLLHMVIIPKPNLNTGTNLSFAEYLTIFTTFIYGFVASIFLKGWSIIIQRYKQLSFQKEHFAWSLLGFCLLIDIWWGSWERESFICSNLGYYVLYLSTPLAFYLLANAIFPVWTTTVNLEKYFEDNRRHICLMFGLVMFSNFLVANLMEESSLLSNENFFRLGALLLTAAIILYARPRVYRVVLICAWALLISHTIIYG